MSFQINHASANQQQYEMYLMLKKEPGRTRYPAQAPQTHRPSSARQAPANMQTQVVQHPARARTLPTPSTVSIAATPAVGTTKKLNPLANFEPSPTTKPIKQLPPKKTPALVYYRTCEEKMKELAEEEGWTLSRERYRELLEWSNEMAELCNHTYSTHFDSFCKIAFKKWPSHLNRGEWDRRERREREIEKRRSRG